MINLPAKIHSIETAGMVDGPGIRFVVFTQGCLLRCQYCHNPDTWDLNSGKITTVEEMMNEMKDYIPYMKHSGGGVTISGGEPLLQIDFLIEFFKKCKEFGIHTTIDSSGGCYSKSKKFQNKLEQLLNYTDLILLDLKHINPNKHRILTGFSNEHVLDFAKHLSDKNIPVWIRHVLVPTITDNEKDLLELSNFISTLQNVQKIEVIPYHKMGVYKWNNLNVKYPLENIEPPTIEEILKAETILKLKNKI